MKLSRDGVYAIVRDSEGEVERLEWRGYKILRRKTNREVAEQCERILSRCSPERQSRLWWVNKIWREALG